MLLALLLALDDSVSFGGLWRFIPLGALRERSKITELLFSFEGWPNELNTSLMSTYVMN